MKEFETVIGLEVHLQLNTKTKVFCSCANQFGQEPNAQTCPVCLGLPGTLPALNEKTLHYAIKVALALNCKINPLIKFDRKNYYYPDLPKGYQISQHNLPIANNGFLLIKSNGATKQIGIHRAHLEEDAGKLIHDTVAHCSLVDYNRTGTPLIEIVSEPDLRSAQEAHDYLTTLKLTLQYLDVSDCDMEKGSLRCDANISIREKGSSELGVKAEVKNMNSFKAVKSALTFEEERQRKLVERGERIIQETRLWSEEKGITVSMRSKEEAHDYRYFPEPDLVPFMVEESIIAQIRNSLPELPAAKFSRFINEYSLSEYDVGVLTQEKDLADFFEQCVHEYANPKKICNWIIGPVQQELNVRKTTILDIKLKPADLVGIIDAVEKGTISNLAAKDVFTLMIDTGKNVGEIISQKGLGQVSDEKALEKIVEEVFNENKDVVAQVKEGKKSAMGFLIGQSMRKSKGKANPKILGEIIKRRFQNG